MRLRRLQLHPFAGTADREVGFGPGLNVVLGPNEAGKSTLQKALRQVFFVPTKLGVREARTEVEPYLPLGGGDTIRVTVDFEVGGAAWRLAKRWAKGNSAVELRRPDGGLVSDPAAVDQTLGELLGLGRGTWENVLFSPQGRIAAALERLNEEGDLRELNNHLRRSVFETDGVSLEKLRSALEKRYKEAFERWDRSLNRPEGNRGLDNRWSRGAGKVVLAWYEREAARVALDEAERYYRRLDEINAELDRVTEADNTQAAWVAANQPVAADAEQRLRLQAALAEVQAKGKGLKEVSQEWPVAAKEAESKEAQAAELRSRAEALGQELARAKAWEEAGALRNLLAEVGKLASEVERVREERDAIAAVDPATLRRLEEIEKERDRIRVRLEAALLRVRITAGTALRLETISGMKPAQPHELAAGGVLDFEAGGRVRIHEADRAWEIEVGSGEIDVATEEARHLALADEAEGLLQSLGAGDLAAAKARAEARREKSRQVEILEQQLASRLGERSLEDLRDAVARAGGEAPEPPRPSHQVSEERGRVESEASALTREATAARQKIEAWTRDFGSVDELLDRIGDLRSEYKALETTLATLRPLPEGMDATAFLREFRDRRALLDARRDESHRLQIERAELSRSEPTLEPAEAAERLALAGEAFERALREGEATERILRDFTALRDELDTDTLVPWQNHLSEILAPLSEGRYRALDAGSGRAARADGISLPLEVLSAGTRACLGLATRLSMARWFLEGREGFLLLDDPFVDLDPRRQEAAVELLRNFAGRTQVLVFTCHPAHAERLGGHRIEL